MIRHYTCGYCPTMVTIVKWLAIFIILFLNLYLVQHTGAVLCDGKYSEQSSDAMSQCAILQPLWSQREAVSSLQKCKEQSCLLGANVFNYLPAEKSLSGKIQCQPRLCDKLGLMPIRLLGGWDVYRRHIFASCKESGFRKEFKQQHGVYSDCAHLVMTSVSSKEECMRLTCEAKGTVFNYRELRTRKDCAIKLCDFNGVHVVSSNGGWDVYHSQLSGKCAKRFLKLYDKSVGVSAECMFRSWASVSSPEECAHIACEHKANVFNYRERACYIHSCTSPLLKLTDRKGWKVFSSETP